jgi:drug/metabolite transporter (DMT)-like permease
MIAILGGLGAAVMWATATLCTSRSSRMIPPVSVLAWVMIVGSAASLPFAAASGVPPQLDARLTGWLVVIGAANVGGLLLVYSALRLGKVGIVAAIASAEGAVAATIAVVAGERLAAGAAMMLALIALGVILAGLSRDRDPAKRRHNGIAVLLSSGAALLFGVGLFAAGHVSTDLPLSWILLPPRVVGVLAVAVPLLLLGKLRFSREAAPYVIAAGIAEIIGLGSYTIGARHGIAISAVLGSQFAALSAIFAFFFFRERLARLQLVGVSAIVVGVSVLTALRA